MQLITISGNIGKDAELRDARDSKVLSFNVGVKNGYGRDAGSVWYRCSLWGKAAEAFANGLTKGTKVFITGELTHDEYEGKPQFNVRVGSIDTGPRPQGQTDSGSQAQGNGGSHTTWENDLDDDVPF
jgi:single-strand DNA-binding protein